MTVTVYIADGCPHCGGLLEDLARRHVACDVVNLSQFPDRVKELLALTWERRLPVVVDHERCTVGFAGGSSSFDQLGVHVP